MQQKFNCNCFRIFRSLKGKLKLILFIAILYFNASSNLLMASDYYWVNGTGKWSEFTLHWATSSGGSVFHTQLPDTNDNVFFDGKIVFF